MTLMNHYQQAWINLSASKLRAFLAILGILVGTAAVVALLSCGQLATEKALSAFKALGTDLLSIALFQQEQSASANNKEQLPLKVWRQIPEKIPAVLSIAPYATAYQAMSFQGHVFQGPVIGADESLASIMNIELARGHFVSFVDSFEHFCVIGNAIAQKIQDLTLDDPIGQQMRLGQTLYSIIGIAKPWKESGFFNEDINQAVIIPILGMPMVSKDSKINNAVMLLKPDSPIDDVIQHIKQWIRSYVPTLTIFPRSAKQIIASMENQAQIFTLLLGVIGSISLVVGGIGIMNVMLVSVSERRKEIGIRKAVGAKNRDIQTLFLVESVMLSLLGGALGVILGILLTWVIAYFSDWSFTIYWMPALAGFGVSVITGIFFGFYPAWRAAKLEPVISLRSE